jgi:phosphoglycerate dehydrogenase-like enzyme
MAIILALLKKTRERDKAMKRGEWRDPALQGIYMGRRQDGYQGLTVGIVGLGRVGRRFADLLAPWRVRILACDPYVHESRFILSNVEPVDLPALLKESDIVSLHVVLTKETRRMIGAQEFALMKQGAILVNTSRGQVVDEKALAEALLNGKLAAAGLDVFEDEPLALDSPLGKMGNKILLSPHMVASNIGSGLGPGIEWATDAILSALNGEVPDNVYNKEAIPKWLDRFGGRRVKGW